MKLISISTVILAFMNIAFFNLDAFASAKCDDVFKACQNQMQNRWATAGEEYCDQAKDSCESREKLNSKKEDVSPQKLTLDPVPAPEPKKVGAYEEHHLVKKLSHDPKLTLDPVPAPEPKKVGAYEEHHLVEKLSHDPKFKWVCNPEKSKIKDRESCLSTGSQAIVKAGCELRTTDAARACTSKNIKDKYGMVTSSVWACEVESVNCAATGYGLTDEDLVRLTDKKAAGGNVSLCAVGTKAQKIAFETGGSTPNTVCVASLQAPVKFNPRQQNGASSGSSAR